ncbi:MAG: hypothetical protein KF805_10630 [Phycisphaeraceae bacterium]|nr:hypothetical protein [Phycisphaeraceae bacterium]
MQCRFVHRCLALGFVAAALACDHARAQVTQYSIFYSLYYNQDGYEPDATPSGLYTTPLLVVQDAADLDSASLSLPENLGDMELTQDATAFYLTDTADTQEQMLTNFPAGEYLFVGEGGNLGSVLFSLYRPETALWSYETPSFSPETYDAAQLIDPNSDFIFEFNSWDSDSEANSRYGILYLYDYNSEVPFFYSASFSNSETQHIIPAGTLPPDRHLVAQLYFSSQISEYVGSAYSIVSFDRATAMHVYTSGETPPCVGDLNFDGFVDDADFVDFVLAYNILDCADPSMPDGCVADLNLDGYVDDADFVIFVGAYNELICP